MMAMDFGLKKRSMSVRISEYGIVGKIARKDCAAKPPDYTTRCATAAC